MSRLRWMSPLLCFLAVIGVMLFGALFEWQGYPTVYIGLRIGLDLPPQLKEWESSDSHGGFHGDGLRMDILRFSAEDGEVVESLIKSRGDLWNLGPFDDYLGGIVYRSGHGATEAGWPRYPENAYWFFRDRHSQKEKALHERSSWNYTAALYDADTDTLYYLEFDT